jgi:hypothetical protein
VIDVISKSDQQEEIKQADTQCLDANFGEKVVLRTKGLVQMRSRREPVSVQQIAVSGHVHTDNAE